MEDGETAGILDKNRQKSNWGTKACKPTDNSCKMIILSLKNVKVKSFEKDFISKVFTTYGFQNVEFFSSDICKYGKGTWSPCNSLTKVNKNSLVIIVKIKGCYVRLPL